MIPKLRIPPMPSRHLLASALVFKWVGMPNSFPIPPIRTHTPLPPREGMSLQGGTSLQSNIPTPLRVRVVVVNMLGGYEGMSGFRDLLSVIAERHAAFA